MKRVWQLQEAKNRLSAVVNEATHHGPQIITRHGVETVVVLAMEEYKQLVAPKTSLVDFLRRSPLAGAGLDLARSSDRGREVEL